jgi:hypothetical protein
MHYAPARAFALTIVLSIVAAVPAMGQEPQLPPGLGEAEAKQGPDLPPGLGGDADEPGLPPGLGSDGSGEAEPGLPPGLGDTAAEADAEEEEESWRDRLPFDLHGFWETRAAVRVVEEEAQPTDWTLGETRLQLESDFYWRDVRFQDTVDIYGDAITERLELDVRQSRVVFSPTASVDVQAGRQVLTWGTGDMLFINDMFPKDWVSYFSGREVEYLKAPSDSLKVGWYPELANVEIVYTPQFAPDRFIKGERISYWNPLLNDHAGHGGQVDYNAPSTWFEDDEIAVRVYRRFGRYEAALYGYSGYWKSPGGQRIIPLGQASFPKLRVYGASIRGTLGPGIANAEIGYYDSYQDRDGTNPLINNSEFRVLVGYEQELAKEFTGAIQWYLEHMMDYEAYRHNRFFFEPIRDKDRHVVTLRLTKLLLNQTLTLSFFGYWSPTDEDAYLRPKATYEITDDWTLEAGLNVWLGEKDTSFFGQFEDNTNVYAGARFSF